MIKRILIYVAFFSLTGILFGAIAQTRKAKPKPTSPFLETGFDLTQSKLPPEFIRVVAMTETVQTIAISRLAEFSGNRYPCCMKLPIAELMTDRQWSATTGFTSAQFPKLL